MDPLLLLALFGIYLVPGSLASLAWSGPRARISPGKLDRDRGRDTGAFWVVATRDCRATRAPGLPSILSSRWVFDSGTWVLTDDAGARYEIDLAGVRLVVPPPQRRPPFEGAPWAPRPGDIVGVRGHVIVEPPTAGYRSAGHDAVTRLRPTEPGSLRARILVRNEA